MMKSLFTRFKSLFPRGIPYSILARTVHIGSVQNYCQQSANVSPLRPKKAKSSRKTIQYFIDSKKVRVIGGNGGDGCISFLQAWANEKAGPDGGDGGNGGHVVLEATHDIKDFNHLMSTIKGEHGEKGANKDCHGKNANHTIIKVPVGTIIKDSKGKIVGDLYKEKLMFVAARGGSGGRGNHFFTTDTEQTPQICEYGAEGEDLGYFLELRSMANVGLIGLPNAGKSTLLRAISRARPKVAPYPFTTLRPHLGVVQYSDYEQIAIADLPGLIPDSHKNKGLGIQFLKHAERCPVLLFVVDASHDDCLQHYESLLYELERFSEKLPERPKILAANKIDLLAEGSEILTHLEENVNIPVIPISAKLGINVAYLLKIIRELHDKVKEEDSDKI